VSGLPTRGELQRRGAEVERLVDALFADFEDLVDPVVSDGWPRRMARAGLELHRQTWNGAEIAETAERELADAGSREPVRSAAHLWPTVPGVGVTPVLYGHVSGVAHQWVRPSRRAPAFARHFVAVWRDVLGDSLGLIEPGGPFDHPEMVIISGSDDAVRAVDATFSGRVVGYGHRVSFATIVDDGLARRWCDGLATDVVMWHQRGCFSARAVVFCGSVVAADAFGAALGEALARRERELDATTLSESEAAMRAQARGVAEFAGRIYGDGVGWVETSHEPFRGEWQAPHVVTLHRIDAVDALDAAVDVPRAQLQGAALGCDDARFADLAETLTQLGVTRVCRPGELQRPPASWPHDGRPNTAPFLR